MPALAQRQGGLLLFLACTRSKARRTFSLSRLHSLKGEEDFFWCLNLPRVYISSPLDALRTFKLASIYLCREVFQSVLTCTRSKARRTSSLLACTRSKSRRTFSCLHSLKVEEDFLSSCLKTHESVEVFNYHWCLRSPKDDEDFKTFNCCRQSLKDDGDFKTFN